MRNLLTTLALSLLSAAISFAVALEPWRQGPIHNRMRQASQIVHGPNPAIEIIEPAPYSEFTGEFVLAFDNWDYRPERATNPQTQFANGFQERNTGHVHGWVFDEFGNQIRFYGAAGTIFDGTFYIKPDDFPPGSYIAYFQLQNHDHTPAIQVNAAAFPSMQAVTFFVEGDDTFFHPVNLMDEDSCKQ